MALTNAQLELIRRHYENNTDALNQTEPEINAAAGAIDTWIIANRASLPATGQFLAGDLTAGQRNQVSNAIDSATSAGLFSTTQKATLFNGTAFFHWVIPPPPTPAWEDPVVLTAIRQHFLSLFDAAIDAAKPGMTTTEKVRAIRTALGL